MREKSQIEDMRAALRGDIDRARARREADPWRAQEPEQQVDPEPAPAVEEHEPAASEGPTPAGSVPVEAAEEPEPVAVETIERPVAVEGPIPEESVPEETPAEPEPVAAETIEEPPLQHEARSGFFARLFRRG